MKAEVIRMEHGVNRNQTKTRPIDHHTSIDKIDRLEIDQKILKEEVVIVEVTVMVANGELNKEVMMISQDSEN